MLDRPETEWADPHGEDVGRVWRDGDRSAEDSCHKGGKSGLTRRLLNHPSAFFRNDSTVYTCCGTMFQNLIKIFRIGELLPQKLFPINPANRKLRNASDHIYGYIVKLFVGFLGHVLSTPIRRIMLNAHGVRSFVCSVDNMRAIRIHHGPCFFASAMGFQQIGSASRLVIRQNASVRLHVLSALSCIYLNYILCHSCGMFNRQRMYGPLYQRPPKATFTS